MDDRSHVRRRVRTPEAGTADARLDALLRALPPAPERLVELAVELPLLERALTLTREGSADPRSALAAVDLEPDPDRLRMFERLRRARGDEPRPENSPADLRT
jgi:hypothetical protein